jgi:hypothetical protein
VYKRPATSRQRGVISLLTLCLAGLAALSFSSNPLALTTARAHEFKSAPAPNGGKLQVAQAWIRELFGSSVVPGPPDRYRRDEESLPESDEDPLPRQRAIPSSGTYRTVCVRLCDGVYFPISFSTYRSYFAKDAERCERSCPNRSRLFVHPQA